MPGTSSSTSCDPAGAGEGTHRFVPLRDPLAFALKCGGLSTNTSGSFPLLDDVCERDEMWKAKGAPVQEVELALDLPC